MRYHTMFYKYIKTLNTMKCFMKEDKTNTCTCWDTCYGAPWHTDSRRLST